MGKSLSRTVPIAVLATLVVFVVLMAIVIMVSTMQDQVDYTNDGGMVETTRSISCESEENVYPFFRNDGAKSRNMKIKAVFSDDKLDKVSLIYRLKYDGEKTIEQMATKYDIVMNEAFDEDGLGGDALGASYSRLEDAVQMNLYAEANLINGITAKYFLLEGLSGHYSIDSLAENYNKMGFSCIINE